MLKLENLKKDGRIRGLEGNTIVRIVSVEPVAPGHLMCRVYNELIAAWYAIVAASRETGNSWISSFGEAIWRRQFFLRLERPTSSS